MFHILWKFSYNLLLSEPRPSLNHYDLFLHIIFCEAFNQQISRKVGVSDPGRVLSVLKFFLSLGFTPWWVMRVGGVG